MIKAVESLCVIFSFVVFLAACGQVNHAEKGHDSVGESGRENLGEINNMSGSKTINQTYIVELDIPNFEALPDLNKAQEIKDIGVKLSRKMERAGADFNLVHSYELLPAILISLDQKFLTTLKQDKYVKSVIENGVSKLQPIPAK